MSPAATLKAKDVATVCVKAKPALESRLGVSSQAITTRHTYTSDRMPQCDFAAGPLAIWVSLDSLPQPYQVLTRRSVEEGQNFAMMPHFKYPQAINHLGLNGWWFPREQQAQTTDGRVLITVTIVRWPDHGNGPRKSLAGAVARRYLGTLVGARTDKGEV